MAHNEFSSQADVRTVVQAGRDVHLNTDRWWQPEPLTQTPLPDPGFTDREQLLDRLAELLDELGEAERTVVIEGPPGVGKRSVARRFAALHRDRFLGGDLHVDCADFGAESGVGRADLHAMMVDVLCGLGVAPEHAPRSLSGLRSCYQDKLHRRPGPVLVVVENAAEPAQVLALRPHRVGSLVLATAAPGSSLRELELHGAEFFQLGGLDERHSARVFHQAAGRTSPATAELIRLCDGIPLALLVLARRVARLHGMTDAQLAERLIDDRRLLASLVMGGRPIVSAALTAAYRSLPPRFRRAYRRLGLLPGADTGPDVAAVALTTDMDEAVETLEALADVQLLRRRAGGRYAFGNNLIRLHAREQAEEDDIENEPKEHREAVLEQVVQHYLLRSAFADHAKRPDRTRIADHGELLAGHSDPFTGPDPARRARDWLDGERANLGAVVQAAYDAGFFRATMLLADALTAYYPDRRDVVAWIHTSTLGAQAARYLNETWAEARLRSMMSRPLTDHGDLERARAELEIAHRLAQRTGDLVLQASVWEFQGRLLAHLRQYDAALDAYRRSQDLNTEAGERRGVALAVAYAAEALRDQGDDERARSYYDHALGLFEELDDGRMAARVRIGLALLQMRAGARDAAAEALRAAAADLDGTHYEAQARVHLADLARAEGDSAAERDHLRRAWEVYRDVGHPAADEIAQRIERL